MAITVYFICYSTYIGISKYIEICKGILECVYVCIAICNLVVQIGLSCERFVSVQTSMVLAGSFSSFFCFLFLLGSWCAGDLLPLLFLFLFPFLSFLFLSGKAVGACAGANGAGGRSFSFAFFSFFLLLFLSWKAVGEFAGANGAGGRYFFLVLFFSFFFFLWKIVGEFAGPNGAGGRFESFGALRDCHFARQSM